MVQCIHYLRLAAELGKLAGTMDANAAIARLRPEIANLEAAFSTAPKLGLRAKAVDAVEGYGRLLQYTGLGEPAPLKTLAEACHTADDPASKAHCLFWFGVVKFYRTNLDAARVAQNEARDLFRQLRNGSLGEANCIKTLGDIAHRTENSNKAREAYLEALSMFREHGDVHDAVQGAADCIRSLGDIALRGEDHDD